MQSARPDRVTVVGTGSWGTTLAILSARQGLATNLLARTGQEAASLRGAGENSRFLPDQPFPQLLQITADAQQALDRCDMLLMVVPSQTMRANIRALKPYLDSKPI